MENKNESTTEPSYDDFEPFCKWRCEEGQDTLEVHLQDFRKEHLRVRIHELGILTITGERPVDDARRSRFHKQIKIPKNSFRTNEIRAKFSGGILYVIVPKKTPPVSAKLSSTEIVTGSTSMPSNYLFGLESSGSKMVINTRLALQAAGLLVVVVAFGAYVYKYCHCFHVES